MLPLINFTLSAQRVPTPKEHWGFNIGDDYCLTNYRDSEQYFKKLAENSPRVKMVDIGETEEGRRQYMLIVSSPENLANLEEYRTISQTMARAEIDQEEALNLSREGKAVVWIDGGIHSTETVSIHQLIETAYQLASREDRETLEILDKVVVLLVHANPDGHELVGDLYMANPVPEKRTWTPLPKMYHKYVGHDNNRDFFMFAMKETENMVHIMFHDWIPQIVYNHHQSGSLKGIVLAGAPYRDPFNYVFDPLLVTSIDAVGAAMQNRLNREGKPGYTQRDGSPFSAWYNGGLRTSCYFHNIIGILTEIIGHPSGHEVSLVKERLVPKSITPNPVLPQEWKFRQSIDYSVSLNYAVLHYAARHSDELLYNIYQMGRNSIEKGSSDTWSLSPSTLKQIEREAGEGNSIKREHIYQAKENRENIDPYGYVIPSDQPDFLTAIHFLNSLIKSGIKVDRATAQFTLDGKSYPKGSYLVKTAQAFRPYILDMFEPQDYPNDFEFEGGPPIPPYDMAGWTLAYLMNVKFDRIMNNISAPSESLGYGIPIEPAEVNIPSAGILKLPAAMNESYRLVNLLMKEGVKIYRDGETGDFFLSASNLGEKGKGIIRSSGLQPAASGGMPKSVFPLKSARIALWDSDQGSMSSGWIRWIFEQYHYNFELVQSSDLEKGNLIKRYDVILFAAGGVPTSKNSVSEQLIKFMEKGGRVVAMGRGSSNLSKELNLPIKSALTEFVDGEEKSLPREKFYIPGSVLSARVATDTPATWGMEEYASIFFKNGELFKPTSRLYEVKGFEPLMWFDSDNPLQSGWLHGASYLKDGIVSYRADVGKGEIYVFGTEIAFRAQTHGTFKLLFNTLYR